MKLKGMYSMALAMAMMAESNMFTDFYEEKPRKYIPKTKDFEPRPQAGQFHYWFRIDGTFLNEKQSERMKKDECVFTCFSINDKNAIKKFNSFMRSSEAGI